MTDQELELIAKRLRAIPWPMDIAGGTEASRFGTWSFGPYDPHSEADAEFHAHARRDVTALLAEVRRLQELVAAHDPRALIEP